jgi:hypothetical protein
MRSSLEKFDTEVHFSGAMKLLDVMISGVGTY